MDQHLPYKSSHAQIGVRLKIIPNDTVRANQRSISALTVIVKLLTVQNKSKLESVAYLRFSPASAKRGLVRFLAWRIEEKEARRVLNFGKQGSYALGTANLTLNFKNTPSLEHLKR